MDYALLLLLPNSNSNSFHSSINNSVLILINKMKTYKKKRLGKKEIFN